MFRIFAPKYVKQGQAFLQDARKLLAYQRDLWSESVVSEFQVGMARLEQALRVSDRGECEEAIAQLDTLASRVVASKADANWRENCEVFLVAILNQFDLGRAQRFALVSRGHDVFVPGGQRYDFGEQAFFRFPRKQQALGPALGTNRFQIVEPDFSLNLFGVRAMALKAGGIENRQNLFLEIDFALTPRIGHGAADKRRKDAEQRTINRGGRRFHKLEREVRT